MKKQISQQLRYFYALLLVALLLGGTTYLQLYRGFNPCALCLLQRAVFGALGVTFLIGALVSKKYRIAQISVAILSTLISLIGVALAGRQVWLQHFPASATGNCEVSLQYMLNALPLDQVIKKIFSGGAECTQVGWEIMHVSLAQWSLLGFIVFGLFSLWQLRRT